MIHPCKESYDSVTDNFQQDYIELVSSVQRHTLCSSACCLKVNQYGNHYCRFIYSVHTNGKTYIKHATSSNSEVRFRLEAVDKLNDPRLSRHQRIQLNAWRENREIQLIVDYNACVEYLTKYASKAEKLSRIYEMHLLVSLIFEYCHRRQLS